MFEQIISESTPEQRQKAVDLLDEMDFRDDLDAFAKEIRDFFIAYIFYYILFLTGMFLMVKYS